MLLAAAGSILYNMAVLSITHRKYIKLCKCTKNRNEVLKEFYFCYKIVLLKNVHSHNNKEWMDGN